jgi:hypothetical protein
MYSRVQTFDDDEENNNLSQNHYELSHISSSSSSSSSSSTVFTRRTSPIVSVSVAAAAATGHVHAHTHTPSDILADRYVYPSEYQSSDQHVARNISVGPAATVSIHSPFGGPEPGAAAAASESAPVAANNLALDSINFHVAQEFDVPGRGHVMRMPVGRWSQCCASSYLFIGALSCGWLVFVMFALWQGWLFDYDSQDSTHTDGGDDGDYDADAANDIVTMFMFSVVSIVIVVFGISMRTCCRPVCVELDDTTFLYRSNCGEPVVLAYHDIDMVEHHKWLWHRRERRCRTVHGFHTACRNGFIVSTSSDLVRFVPYDADEFLRMIQRTPLGPRLFSEWRND